MSLSARATLLALFVMLATVTAGYLAREMILNPRLLEIEHHNDLQDISRFRESLNRYQQNLEDRVKRILTVAGFLEAIGKDVQWQPFLQELARIGGYEELDYFILSDNSGENSVLRTAELADKYQHPPAAGAMNEIIKHILPRLEGHAGAAISGRFLSKSDGPLVYAATRTQWSNSRLPTIYIAIRRLNRDLIHQLNQQLGLAASITSEAELNNALARYNVPLDMRTQDNTLYTYIKGDAGDAIAPLRFETGPRAFDDKIFSPTFLAAMGFAVIAWFVVLLLMRRSIIAPIRDLATQMRLIRQNNNYSQELKVSLGGEFDQLVKECNELLTHVDGHTRQLETFSYKDALTGLGNRRLFQERLDYQWRLARRNSLTISAVVFDLDYFKQYNDNYGHTEGDNVLREFAQVLERNFTRDTDVIARTGGEEFIVLLLDVQEQDAFNLADNTLSQLRRRGLPHSASGDDAKVVTASGGVASILPSDQQSAETLIRQADAALYRAKNAGRDQVMRYHPAGIFSLQRNTEQ